VNTYIHISDALDVVAQTSWMLAAALLLIVGLQMAAATVRAGTTAPSTTFSGTLLRAALDEARSVKVEVKAASTHPLSSKDRHRQDGPSSPGPLLVVLAISSLGAIAVALSGHAPDKGPAMLSVLVVLSLGAVLAARALKASSRDSAFTGFDIRIFASVLMVEASLVIALIVSLAVVAHTGGLNALSFIEAAAIACCTTLAIRLGPLPRGLITADIVFVVPLTWIGVPLHVALAAVLIWRLGSLIVVAIGVIVARATAPTSLRRSHERDRNRILHRVAFGLLSGLPGRLKHRTRATAFDAMFTRSGDPWAYFSNAYESRKRESLLTAVGSQPTCILEVGCANGHNLLALAERFPTAMVIGTDVSPKAMESAQALTSHVPNIRLLDTDEVNSYGFEEGGGVDCIVLSEILYYLGPELAVRSTLGYLTSLALPTCQVVMVHGSVDAAQLHARANKALRLQDVRDQVVQDPDGTYLISIANIFPVQVQKDSYPVATWSSAEVSIRAARRPDMHAMARLHLSDFPLSLYARMGEGFMAAIYRQWMNAHGSFATVATINGSITGFAVGNHGSYRCRSLDLIFSTFVGMSALAPRPHLWKRATLHYARLIRRKLRGGSGNRDSELTFIAVDPKHRKRGIGSALLGAFEIFARSGGSGHCTLVTEETNEVARTFYAHRGWREVNSTRSADGRPLVRLETSLEAA
jgi:ribosomal protein S18 acetylase RimI-like enzyme